MLALIIGNLILSDLSASILAFFSFLFIASFLITSIKNDNAGMMNWIFNKTNQTGKK
tara:strand:+ start:76 stop:246 length:171 start_codon:yes stop_codon:yes gene_type:complete